MRLFVSQIYIHAGVSFPFSIKMQRYVGEEVEKCVRSIADFEKHFGVGYDLIVRVSAEAGSSKVRVLGPTVFRRERDVEYTVFLPYDAIIGDSDSRGVAIGHLMAGIASVLGMARLAADGLSECEARIRKSVIEEPAMLSEPWPVR